MNKNFKQKAANILAADKDDYINRLCELVLQFSRLSAKKRARLISNLDEVFSMDDVKSRQKLADDFEFFFYIYKQAQDVLSPDSFSDGRKALADIRVKIYQRYPNIKSIYDLRRASISYSDFMKMSKEEVEKIDNIFKREDKTDA